ncbi:MAG: hypothetical protein LM564_00275 [Desulfurococcaceae archaeon]|nr:hypothetical protein [Desulfurococcaceae archaeon]
MAKPWSTTKKTTGRVGSLKTLSRFSPSLNPQRKTPDPRASQKDLRKFLKSPLTTTASLTLDRVGAVLNPRRAPQAGAPPKLKNWEENA